MCGHNPKDGVHLERVRRKGQQAASRVGLEFGAKVPVPCARQCPPYLPVLNARNTACPRSFQLGRARARTKVTPGRRPRRAGQRATHRLSESHKRQSYASGF